jgi:diacylglycerol kinase family enzyme
VGGLACVTADDAPVPSACVILNMRSGGGRHQPAIRTSALRRGMDVRIVGPGADPATLAAAAQVDVLVAGGGDGTVSAVAAVAVERNLPLVILPCGTRNHFALDVGLDTADPGAALGAVENGVERRVDLGMVNGRVFVNNVSVGFYGPMVQDPQYRSKRIAVSVRYARRALLGGGDTLGVVMPAQPRLVLPERVLTILVSNNAYSPGVAPGAALRPRLDEGMLWTHVLGMDRHRGPLLYSVLRSVFGLLTGRSQVAAWPAVEQTLWIDRPVATVGMDGEAVELSTPLEFRVLAGALRLLAPPLPDPGEVRIELHL